VSVLEVVRRANQPGVPENSIRLRLACLGAALVAIAACASLQEIAWTTAVGAMVLVSAGTAFSHATRARPPGWVKVMVALGAIAACVWFFHAVGSPLAGVKRSRALPLRLSSVPKPSGQNMSMVEVRRTESGRRAGCTGTGSAGAGSRVVGPGSKIMFSW